LGHCVLLAGAPVHWSLCNQSEAILSEEDKDAQLIIIQEKLRRLRFQQIEFIGAVVEQLARPVSITLGKNVPASLQLVNEAVGQRIGDALQVHHAFSRQALSKDRFEFAFEAALNKAGVKANLETNRTNRGHDITIAGVPVSLKTQADASIKRDSLHISKFMELGSGKWELPLLRAQFFEHMKAYDRIFQFRCLEKENGTFEYELVEIPKTLLARAATGLLQTQEDSKQTPKPGYCYVYQNPAVESKEGLLFALYFDGGTERKLQIKHIKKSECIVHANWKFQSTTF
jgi:Type II site-specific deoxyribonuclease